MWVIRAWRAGSRPADGGTEARKNHHAQSWARDSREHGGTWEIPRMCPPWLGTSQAWSGEGLGPWWLLWQCFLQVPGDVPVPAPE